MDKGCVRTETFDTDNCFASNKFTPTKSGYYQINAMIQCQSNFNVRADTAIYKNGSAIIYAGGPQGPDGVASYEMSMVVYMNGSTDYIELYGYITTGGGPRFNGGVATQMSGAWIRS